MKTTCGKKFHVLPAFAETYDFFIFQNQRPEEYALIFNKTVIDQYLQLILQCYFNGHAMVLAGTFLITGF